jgi:hypothetical protein
VDELRKIIGIEDECVLLLEAISETWKFLQVGSPAPASKENIEDQRKADEEKKLSGTVSSLSKWKVGGQTDVKRREFFEFSFVDFVVDISQASVYCDQERKHKVCVV